MEKVIDVKNLVKKYNNFIAVNDISFELYKGECFGILGPNGAGKTSIIKVLYGYFPKTSGKIFFYNKSLEENLIEIKSSIGVVEQENCLDTELTVLENLTVHARYFGIKKEISKPLAISLLNKFELTEKKDKIVENLSGGMKRKLMIARALINNPDIIIFDEPTIGLDPQSKHMIWDMILSLKKEGKTILLTTHYMDEAERLCERLLIMDNGKIVTEGIPNNLVKKIIGDFVLEIENYNDKLLDYIKRKGLNYELSSERVFIYGLNNLMCKNMRDNKIVSPPVRDDRTQGNMNKNEFTKQSDLIFSNLKDTENQSLINQGTTKNNTEIVSGSDLSDNEELKEILKDFKYIFRTATLEDVFLKLTGRKIRNE